MDPVESVTFDAGSNGTSIYDSTYRMLTSDHLRSACDINRDLDVLDGQDGEEDHHYVTALGILPSDYDYFDLDYMCVITSVYVCVCVCVCV